MNRNELLAAKATVIIQGMMGQIAFEVSSFSTGVDQYAQYAESVWIRYVKKGKRKMEGVRYTDNVNMVVLEGWNLEKAHVDLRAEAQEDVVKHIADEQSEARALSHVDALIKNGAKVLADFRGHKTNGRGEAPKFNV